MRSNDLVPLLAPKKAEGLGYRQGVVVSWDQETAENTILVAGSVFENLPILNTSEASLLVAGDVIAVISTGPSWAILGRVIIPGTPEAASSIKAITNRIQAAEEVTNGTRNSTSWGNLTGAGVGPSVTVKVGSSGRVLAFWSCEIGQATVGGFLQSQTKTTPHVGIELSGANTVAPEVWRAFNVNLDGASASQFWIQSTAMHLYTDLTPGDTTFTMKYRHDGMTPAADANFNAREIAVFVL